MIRHHSAKVRISAWLEKQMKFLLENDTYSIGMSSNYLKDKAYSVPVRLE